MNLLLIHPTEIKEGRCVLTGRRAAHVHKVLKSKVGDSIRIGISGQALGSALVAESHEQRLVLEALKQEQAEPKPCVRIIVALPRPKALRRLLQTTACFGVAHIDIVNAWKVEKSYWSSAELEEASMLEQLKIGCEQGRHPWVPTLRKVRFLVPFLKEMKTKSGQCRLLAHPGDSPWFGEHDLEPSEKVIAFGPEGGWVASELQSFEDAGFKYVGISNSILRSEIAIAAALAQLQLLEKK